MMTTIAQFVAEMRGVFRIANRRTGWRYLITVIKEFPRILMNRSLGTADARMLDQEYVFSVGYGRKVSLQGACFGLAREIYGRRVYTGMNGFEIHEDDTVVDLGANVGAFAVMAGVLSSSVIAVEAQSGFIPLLRENLRKNNVKRWAVEWGLIAGGTGAFSNEMEQKRAAQWGDEPPRITIEHLIDKYELDSIDFLKVDIEGSEFDLLRGSRWWLTRVRRIAMEVHQEFGRCEELVDLLRESGFTVIVTDNRQKRVTELQDNYGFIFAKRQGNVDKVRSRG
jgi:FkbM family methyltransferase